MAIKAKLPSRLHHTAYVSRDLEATRKFYEEVIGLPLLATWCEKDMQAGAQLTDESLRGALLGDSARSHPFEDAADVNRIEDVTRRERANHIAARAVFDEKTFLSEQWERLANRGT